MTSYRRPQVRILYPPPRRNETLIFRPSVNSGLHNKSVAPFQNHFVILRFLPNFFRNLERRNASVLLSFVKKTKRKLARAISTRRRARADDWDRLENDYGRKVIRGSNPLASATMRLSELLI